MTDIYGGEPHDPENGQDRGHDEVVTPEQEAVHEAPSDYEFADAPADDHGAAAATDEEEHAEDMGVLPAEPPAARRSPILPIVAAAAGVLLLGVVAWWQFSGPSEAPPPAADVAAMAPIPVAPPAETPVAPDSVPVSTVAPKIAAAPPPLATLPVVPQASMAPATPLPAAPSSAEEDQRLAALTARIDDLQKALDQATQQLGQVTNMVAATAGGTSASSKNLQDRIDKLEAQLELMNHASPVLAAPAAAPKTVKHAAPHHAPVSAAVHKAVPKVKTVIIEKPAAASEQAAANQWVLRAAAPGQAWVAASPTSRDLKALHVGDTLPGIGRVTAIKEQNGAWSVQGTTGVIQ